MILVFGATGKVGRSVVSGLMAAGAQVRAFVRSPESAGFDPEVSLVRGDLGDPFSIAPALSDVEAAFVLSAGPDALGHDLAVAHAVRRARTPFVVRLSSVAALPPVLNSYGRAHAEAERVFSDSGAAWTFLRPAAFASNTLEWAWSVRGEGRVYQPYGKIPQAIVAPEDVAAVAVRALLEPSVHSGQTYVLTGPEAITPEERSARLAAALGRPIEFVDAAPELAKQAMVGAGLPPDYVDGVLESQADPDPARGGTPLPTVSELLGRPATPFDTWLNANLGAFTA